MDLFLPDLNRTLTFPSVPDRTKLWTLISDLVEPELTDSIQPTDEEKDLPEVADVMKQIPAEVDDVTKQLPEVDDVIVPRACPLKVDELAVYRSVGYGGLLLYLKAEPR